jgi:transposase-like protein
LTVTNSSKTQPAVSIADLGLTIEEISGQPIDLIAREGARVILEIALNEEVAAFLNRRRYERSEAGAAGYRNGTRERTLQCGSGEVVIRKPKIVGAEEPFESKVVERWRRRSQYLEAVLPALVR